MSHLEVTGQYNPAPPAAKLTRGTRPAAFDHRTRFLTVAAL
jgi:hypothetical protein